LRPVSGSTAKGGRAENSNSHFAMNNILQPWLESRETPFSQKDNQLRENPTDKIINVEAASQLANDRQNIFQLFSATSSARLNTLIKAFTLSKSTE